MKKKTKITVISVVSVLALAVIITVCVLFIPLNGKKQDDFWAATDAYASEDVATVEKKAGEDFKILFLTDLQLWSDGADNKEALKIATDCAASVKPDLIILGGDNVSGLTTNYLTKDFIKCMESIGVPWAPVFGNHDSEGKATLEWQGDRFEEAKHCLFGRGPSNVAGVGNYAINITENGNIVETLILLDSGRYRRYPDGAKRESYIGYDQQAWYRWNIEGASRAAYGDYAPAEGKVVKSMAFFHYALPEMKEALEPYLSEDGLCVVPESIGFGEIGERMCVQYMNSGMFELAKSLGSTTDFFFGHDHANNASLTYEGIRMTYGMKTGPSPKPWNDAEQYGGTVILLGDNGATSVSHYVHSDAKR